MKVEIRDVDAVRALRPLEVAAYLRSRGWVKEATHTGRSAIWTLTVAGEEYEGLLPLDQAMRDFPLRMGDLLRVLARAEGRSEAEIFNDLLTATADVLRIRIQDPELRDGTMPVDAHARMAQEARDLVLAAACAVVEHRAVWYTRKPAQAMEHLRRVRIGQTERGSYVVTVISRVAPSLEAHRRVLIGVEPPYERQVMLQLAGALAELQRTAEHAALNGEIASVSETVRHGVSANLCAAVVGLWGEEVAQRRLAFGFAWAPARAADMTVPTEVSFAEDRIPVIREVGRLLREQAPVSDFELEGAVVKLERPEGATTGRATVMGMVEGRSRRIVMELSDSDYRTAMQAHAQQMPIRGVGTLVREGKSYSLQGPREIVLGEE